MPIYSLNDEKKKYITYEPPQAKEGFLSATICQSCQNGFISTKVSNICSTCKSNERPILKVEEFDMKYTSSSLKRFCKTKESKSDRLFRDWLNSK